jgi:hypothetical protein
MPAGKEFSEFYVLGPNHTFDNIPYNVKVGETYLVYLGIGNHMGSSSYYTSIVKLYNETGPLPNTTLGTLSQTQALYEYKSFVNDEAYWEAPLIFQVKTLTFANNISYLPNITINGLDFTVNKSVEWNSNKTGYYYGLFVELWIFNSTSGVSQYHNRSVNLILNMTR